MLLIFIIDFILQLKKIKIYVIIVDFFHLTYSAKRTKWLKVGMSDTQKWIEEVLEPNKTLFLCFSLCMYTFYDRALKQFLQL